MADPTSDQSELPTQQPTQQVLKERAAYEVVREYAARRRKRILSAFGAATAGRINTSATERHVLQKDFLTLTITAGSVEVEVLRDADAGMRFFLSEPYASYLAVIATMAKGDMLYHDGGDLVVLAAPAVASVLLHDTNAPVWSPI